MTCQSCNYPLIWDEEMGIMETGPLCGDCEE